MKYLLPSQLETALRIDHPIEQLIGTFEIDSHKALRWISIDKSKTGYELTLHEMFDDSDEGIASFYDFSYVEPDDIYGRAVFTSESLTETLTFAEKEFRATQGHYLNFGLLDELLK